MLLSDEKMTGIQAKASAGPTLSAQPNTVSKPSHQVQNSSKHSKLAVPNYNVFRKATEEDQDPGLENKNDITIPANYDFKAFSKKHNSISICRGNSSNYDFAPFPIRTPRTSEPMRLDPDSSFDDESLNENKGFIHPMMLETKMNMKVLKTPKHSRFNHKSVSQQPSQENMLFFPASILNQGQHNADSRNSSTYYSNLPADILKADKITGPKSFYPVNGPSSPEQIRKPEMEFVFGDAFLGIEQQRQYENLDKTNRIKPDASKCVSFEIKELKKRAGSFRRQAKAVTDPRYIVRKSMSRESLHSISMGKLSKKSLSITRENVPKPVHVTLADLEEKNYSDILLKAIFNHDLLIMKKILRKREFPIDINVPDALGNTPLMLATKLSYRNPQYLEVVKCLLSYGADPKIKDGSGWSCLDEAVSQADNNLLTIIFEGLTEFKARTIARQKDDLIKLLEQTPNFYMEMKWDFESSVIPFVSKIAPSDTFRIWKFGKYIRMDYTLTGFKRLSAKRRNMSIVFNCNIDTPQEYSTCAPLFSINRDKNQYTNILQSVEPDEKKLLVQDLLKAEPLQGNFDIKSCHWVENKETGLFGSSKNSKVNEWNTKRYDFKLLLEYALFKKSKAMFRDNHETYTAGLKEALLLARSDSTRKETDILSQIKQINQANPDRLKQEKRTQIFESAEISDADVLNFKSLSNKKLKIETFENTQVSEKKSSASLWVAPNFPINLQSFLPVLGFLSKGNNLLQKLESLLTREDIKPILNENAFPVKLQVPLTLSVKANMTMMTCKPLETANLQELFFLPPNFEYANRRDAQKTLIRAKKRMILINTLI